MNKIIASFALLKTNWDSIQHRRDYLEGFIPFIATLFNRRKYTYVGIQTILVDFQTDYGLSVPYHPMQAILSRAVRAGVIRRQLDGKYSPVKSKVAELDFTDLALEEERKYKNIIEKFRSFSCDNYGQQLSEADAENVLVSFLKDHDLDILFINSDYKTLLPPSNATTAEKHLINSFVANASRSDPETFSFIVDMSVGHIYANTLMCRDLTKYKGDWPKCNIYLDAGLLFSIMGLNGNDKKTAYTDFLKMLKEAKACLFVFRHTYEEFMGILDGCLQWVENQNFEPSKASRAAIHFVEEGLSASDVEQFINAVPRRLSEFEIQVIDPPSPHTDESFQIDEEALTRLIVNVYKDSDASFDEIEKELTINRDIKSISAVFKLRRNQKPTSLREVRELFVTTNSGLAYSSRLFEVQDSQNDFFFIPVALTDVFLGTLIWIQSPKRIVELNERRLIARCYAALQPNRALVKKLTETADELRKQEKITEEELVLLKQSRVARTLLQEQTLGDPNRFSDKTLNEILEGIGKEARREEALKYQSDRDKMKSEVDEAKALANGTEQKYREAQDQLEAVKAVQARTESNLALFAERVAKVSTFAVFLAGCAIIFVAVIFPVIPSLAGQNRILGLVLEIFAMGIISVLGFAIYRFGNTGETLRKLLQVRILHVLQRVYYGPNLAGRAANPRWDRIRSIPPLLWKRWRGCLAIAGFSVALFTLIFGNNIYAQFTGHSVFGSSIIPTPTISTNPTLPVIHPSPSGTPTSTNIN